MRKASGAEVFRSLARVLGGASLLGMTACSFRAETFILAAGTEHGWVTIEQGHEGCQPWRLGTIFTTVEIPVSRVVCTSTATYHGLAYDRYFLADGHGGLTRLAIGDQVHRREGFSYGSLGDRCQASGIRFYFGTATELKQNPSPTPPPEFVAQYHPGCQGSVLW